MTTWLGASATGEEGKYGPATTVRAVCPCGNAKDVRESYSKSRKEEHPTIVIIT